MDESLELGRHHWAENVGPMPETDCIKSGLRTERGTDCCAACRKHNEIDMGWLEPTKKTIRPGVPGVVVILTDATGSISPVNKKRISSEVSQIISRNPRALVLAFGKNVVDITSDPSRLTGPLWECHEGSDWGGDNNAWRRSKGGEGTYLGKALEMAARLNPSSTKVLSDGGTADKALMFSVADRMTGTIDAFFCEPRREEFDLEHHFISADELWSFYSRGADMKAMQELARRGGGTFDVYPSKRGIYSDYGIREGHMDRRRFGGGNVNIQGPGRRSVKLEEHIDIYHERVIHHHRMEDRHEGDATPHDTNLDFAPAQVNYQERKSEEIVFAPKRGALPAFLGWLAHGSKGQQALPSPQAQYRGELGSAPQSAPQVTHRREAPLAQLPALPADARTMEEAFAQGRLAAQSGAMLEHCPYPASDGRRNAWVGGLQSALAQPSGGRAPVMISRDKVR